MSKIVFYFARLLILIKFGGIYIDNDIVLLQRIDELIKSPVPVLGEESDMSIANGFIIARSNSKILAKWLLEYKKYDVPEGLRYEPFSVMKIWQLWFRYPTEINVIKNIMIRPDWSEWDLFWYKHLDWKTMFNMHLNEKLLVIQNITLTDLSDIDCLDNTFGEVTRFIAYRRVFPPRGWDLRADLKSPQNEFGGLIR